MIVTNRFEVEKELGRGGMGIVYQAFDKQNNNKVVVIKVLIDNPSTNHIQWLQKHFFQEAQALKTINHPGVVQLVDVGQTIEGKAFFAMEYIDGYDLHSQIDPSRGLIGDYKRVASIIQQLGEAISAAHEKGIYHRDLKPQNIMLQKPSSIDEDEQVKVIDFGIAKVKSSIYEKTQTTEVFAGSLLYMAPEHFESKASASSDIYALGVIAYQMVTGRLPFNPEGNNPMAMAVKLMEMQAKGVRLKPTDLRHSLPSLAEQTILKALSYSPKDRYKTAKEFGDRLYEALLEESPTIPYLTPSVENTSFPQIETKPYSSVQIQETRVEVTLAPQTPITKIEQEFPVSRTRVETNLQPSKTQIDSTTQPSTTIEVPRKNKLRNLFLFISITLLALSAIGVGIFWGKYYSNEYKLTYSVELREFYDGKYKVPKTVTGITVLYNDSDEIRFSFTLSQAGYIYMLNESSEPLDKNIPQYYWLFPPQKQSNFFDAGQLIKIPKEEFPALVFKGSKGTEKIWIIWTEKQIPELENVKSLLNDNETVVNGVIKDINKVNSIKNLLEKYATTPKNNASKTMEATSTNNIIALKVELEHN